VARPAPRGLGGMRKAGAACELAQMNPLSAVAREIRLAG